MHEPSELRAILKYTRRAYRAAAGAVLFSELARMVGPALMPTRCEWQTIVSAPHPEGKFVRLECSSPCDVREEAIPLGWEPAHTMATGAHLGLFIDLVADDLRGRFAAIGEAMAAFPEGSAHRDR